MIRAHVVENSGKYIAIFKGENGSPNLSSYEYSRQRDLIRGLVRMSHMFSSPIALVKTDKDIKYIS
jgi:hypothetical protein